MFRLDYVYSAKLQQTTAKFGDSISVEISDMAKLLR